MLVVTIHDKNGKERYYLREHEDDLVPDKFSIKTLLDLMQKDSMTGDRIRVDRLIPEEHNGIH